MTVAKLQLSASLEDYLEAIYNLVDKAEVARSKDIAEMLGVSRASVTGALRALKKKGLANYKPYDYVTLTTKGREAAEKIVRKHNVLEFFFTNVLGINNRTAQAAACKAEHTLGPAVISRLLSFIEFVTHNTQNGYDLTDKFRDFYEQRDNQNEK